MLKRRYSFFIGPSGPYTTQEATVPSPAVWLMSKHSSRSGVRVEAQQPRQLLEHHADVGAPRAAHAQRLRGVLHRHRHPARRQRARRPPQSRACVPARSPSAAISASASASSRFTRISGGGGVSA